MVTLHPSPGAHDPFVLGKNLLAKWLKYLSSGPKISAGLRMVASGYSSLTAFSPAACKVEFNKTCHVDLHLNTYTTSSNRIHAYDI